MNNPVSFDLAEPTNTPEQAAKVFLAAVNSGDCKKVQSQVNSDAVELTAENCQALFNAYKGLEAVGSQQYGPLALPQFGDKEANGGGTVEFMIDSDLKLKYWADSVITGGGIRPPNEGFDAQETMDAALEAIREDDETAFAETLGPDGSNTEAEKPLSDFISKPGGKIIADAIRENPDVDAVMIGANQAGAYFIFDTGDRDFVLELGHSPGSVTKYRNLGYAGLPPVQT